jgi:hypothetical protein
MYRAVIGIARFLNVGRPVAISPDPLTSRKTAGAVIADFDLADTHGNTQMNGRTPTIRQTIFRMA